MVWLKFPQNQLYFWEQKNFCESLDGAWRSTCLRLFASFCNFFLEIEKKLIRKNLIFKMNFLIIHLKKDM